MFFRIYLSVDFVDFVAINGLFSLSSVCFRGDIFMGLLLTHEPVPHVRHGSTLFHQHIMAGDARLFLQGEVVEVVTDRTIGIGQLRRVVFGHQSRTSERVQQSQIVRVPE